MIIIEEDDLQLLTKLHIRDIILLVAVIMKVKPIITLIVPLEVREWLQRFCERNHLIHYKTGPTDSHQTRITVCYDKETAKLKKIFGEIHSLFNDIKGTPIISRKKRAFNEFMKSLIKLKGAMYGYPECCIEFHAEKGPSSRAIAYEELLESGRDQSIPIEFWAVAHAPCSSKCKRTLELGRKYLDAIAEFSESLKNHVESRLILPRFYQTGGGRFIELQPLDYKVYQEKLSVSKGKFENEARSYLPEPIEIVLCEIPRPYVLVDAPEEPPYKTSFPNPQMMGIMWFAYNPGIGGYMINAKTRELALYILSEKWISKVGEEWRSKANFRIYRSNF